MALGTAVLTLLELLGFCLGFASLGNVLLRFLRLEMESDGEHFLATVAAGLAACEILLFLVQITQHIRLGCLAVVTVLCGLLAWEWKRVWKRLRGALRQMAPQSPIGKLFLTLVVAVVAVEFLAALAPLTGSDALQYHFTVQKLILEQGFHPFYSNTQSLLCGQHHLLILLGLALGSEQLALGFIFLGGILTAAALACLASRWTSRGIATGFALLFLLTPVVFWQMTSSGSPDIYMAFLASAAVIAFAQENGTEAWRKAILVGFLAGGIAGAKYTGCFVAAALALSVVVEFRSATSASLFLAGSLVSGIWPYLRNLVWTGSPVFPFLATRLSAKLATPYALAALFSDTGTSVRHNVVQVLPFAFFAGARSSSPGLWEFFGPTVLVLAPLIVFAFRNERRWRVLTMVWIVSSLGVSYFSGLTRYLLPVFPIALAGAAAGFEVSLRERWTVIRGLTGSLLVLTGLAGAVGLAIYARAPLRAAIGLEERTDYLRERGPEYQIAETVNRVLGGDKSRKKALVFLRHIYYLEVPYVNGDPGLSFEVDPTKLQSPHDWIVFFEEKNIGYVVRSPNYPSVIAGPLEEMERVGDLVPLAHVEVQSFQGMRVNQTRTTIPVVVFKVNR